MKHKRRVSLRKPMALLLATVLVLSFVPPQVLNIGAVAQNAVEGNLIPNGSFDEDLSGWKSAPVEGGTGHLSWQEGTGQLKTDSVFGMENEVLVEVIPSGTYSLSYTETLSENAELSAYAYHYTQEGFLADMPYQRLNISAEAHTKEYSGEFQVPADTYQIGIRFVLKSKDGSEVTATMDDVVLRCVSEIGNVLNAQNMPANLTAYDAVDQMLLAAMRNSANNPEFSLDVNFEDSETLPWSLWSGSAVANGVLTQSADSNGYAEGSQHYAVESGKTYEISAKIKASGRSQAVLWIWEYDDSGKQIGTIPFVKFYSNGSADWETFAVAYMPSAKAVSVLFHLQTNEGNNKGGSMQWDYVKVALKAEEPPVTEPEETQPPQEKPAFNLNVNFADGETLPWSLWSGSTVADSVLTQSADSNGYAEGHQHYAVEAGKTYELSAKIKANGRTQAVFWVWEYDDSGKQIGTIPFVKFYSIGSADWEMFTAEYTPSTNAATVLFHLQTNEGNNKGGSMQWDYVKVALKEEEPPVTEPEEPQPPQEKPAFNLDVSFNDGTRYPWSLWSGSIVANGVLTQSADSNGYAEGSQHYMVEAGKTYELSAKIKANGRSQAIFWIWEYDDSGKQIGTIPFVKFYSNGSADWETFAVEYTPSANAATVLFHLQTNEGNNKGGSVQWDYVKVALKEEEPPVTEPEEPQPPQEKLAFNLDVSFEDGTQYPWNLWSGSIVANGVLTQSADSNGYAEANCIYLVEVGKTYELSAKIKASGRAQAIFWIWEYDDSGNQIGTIPFVKFYENGSADWEDFVAEYTPSANATSVLFHLQTNEGNNKGGSVQWDHVKVKEKEVTPVEPDTCVPPNGNFEQGSASWDVVTQGSGSFSVETVDGNTVMKTVLGTDEGQIYGWSNQVPVKPNYVYTISYRIQVTPDSSENLMSYGAITNIQEFSGGVATGYAQNSAARNKTKGWETITYEFITSGNAETIRIDFMYANNPGTALWDDFSITEKEAYEPIILDDKYDHGGTEDTASADNVIANGTFDNGIIQGWSPKEGIAAYQTKNENGGVVQFNAKPGSYLQSNELVVEGLSEYKLTYYVKVEDANNLEFISYFFTGSGENWKDFLTTRVSTNTRGKWQEVTVKFATPALPAGTKGFLGFKAVHTQTCDWQKTNQDADCTCHSSAVIYLDDISLIRIGEIIDVGDGKTSQDSILYNGTFDRYYADPKTVDGWDLNILNPNHDTYVQSEVAKSGNAVAINATGHSYIWAQDFSVEPGNIYILSFWVKVDHANGLKFAPYMNDHNNHGGWWLDDAATPIYDVTDGWVMVASPVSIPASVGNNANNPDCNIQLGFQVYEGSGVLYLDEVSFVKTDVDAEDPNMDFELSSEILYNWGSASFGGKGSVKPSSVVRAGSNSTVSADVYNGTSDGSTILVSKLLPVKPKTTYEFSYWVKIDGNYDSSCTPHFRQIAEDGVNSATSLAWDGNNQVAVYSEMISPFWTYQVYGNIDWRQVSMSVTTGPDTHFLELRMTVVGANTHAYIDDVSLRETVEDVNLDFERTSSVTGAPMNWYISGGGSQNIVSESDTTMYHSGKQSYHIVKDSLLERTMIDSCAYIPVDPDMTYEFSFWVSSRNCSPTATIRMNMQLYTADGTRIYMTDGNYRTMQGTVVSLNSSEACSQWTKVTTRAKPVAEAAYATISFVVSRGDAEIWLDDIFVNVVEDGTDCVVSYDDFHALDQDGNTGWTMETISGEAEFTSGNGGKLTVSSGESYVFSEMKQIMTEYSYTIKGNYSADIGGSAEMRFYDYMHNEIEDSRVVLPLRADAEAFTLSFTAPSNSFARLYIGSDQAGTIELKDITIYMVAKPADSSDWDGLWVWYPENPVEDAVEQYRYFRYTFTLDDEAEYAPFQLTVDDKYAFYLNGELIDDNWDAGTDSWANVASYDLTDKVKKGENVIALKCYNLVSEAAVLFDGKFTLKNQSTAIVASNSSVRSTKTVDEQSMSWIEMDYDDSGWTGCKEYGQPPCSPWGPVFYNSTLYINNTAKVLSTTVPETVTAGRDLVFTMTLQLESPIEANFTPTVTIYKRNSINSITSVPLTFVTYDKPLQWPVGEPFEVECRVSIPDYMQTGKYTLQMDENMLLLTGDDVYDNKFLDFKAIETSSGRDNVVSSIEVYNGTPTLIIDGEPMASHFYLRPDLNVYLQTDAETRIYKSELELYITYGGSLYKGGCDPIWLEDGSIDYEAFDSVIYETLAANNDALVMVQIGMFAPNWWLEENPDHRLLAHNGSDYIGMYDVSLASEKFREEAGEVLRLLIRHMKEQSYYNRVFGLKIGGGQSYEWMCIGTGADQGPDYSPVSQEGFKKYLQRVYGTEEALQKAWGDDTVTFENATAPGWLERSASPNVYMGDADTGKLSRNMVDWNLWLNEASADSFLYYCQIAKEETDNQIIVGGYNGYLWTSNSYDSQGMAHTAMDRVLDSEYVDYIASPVAYNERVLGQSNTYMALIDSVQEHGKLYIAEQDNRTVLSSAYAGAPWDADWDFSIGQTRTVADTIYQQKRDFANALVNSVGLWQYDMYGGWLDDDQIYQYLADAKAEYDLSVYLERDARNEVAIFVGDETYAYMTVGGLNMGYTLFEPMLMQQRKHLAAMGAGYDTYAMSSLLDGKVEPHKLNIIFSPYEITEEMNAAIDKYLKCNGQYVVWVYLPGISDGYSMNPDYMQRVTGFDIGLIEKSSALQVQIAKTNNSLTSGIEGLVYGNSTPNSVSPMPYIKNTDGVEVLGYNLDNNEGAGLGIKDMGDWVSIYSAAPCLDVNLLRNMLELAGCHIYSENNADVIYSSNNYVALHSATAEEKTITLNGNYAVYDVFEQKFVSMNTNTITYYHDANDTHIFRLTTPNTYAVTARLKAGKGTLSAPGLKELTPGESYDLTVTPADGYELSYVLVNGEETQPVDGVLHIDSVNENTVIEVKFNKMPEMVEITEYIEELIILPWPAAIGILAAAVAAVWGITIGVKAIRRKLEEGGY